MERRVIPAFLQTLNAYDKKRNIFGGFNKSKNRTQKSWHTYIGLTTVLFYEAWLCNVGVRGFFAFLKDA
jgi:hypothetical protein